MAGATRRCVIVTVTFDERDGKTHLVSRELYPSKEARDAAIASGMEHGMRETMDQLDELVASLAVNAAKSASGAFDDANDSLLEQHGDCRRDVCLFALSYLTGNEQVVSGFAKAGYPQHLRIVLGIVKPAAAVVLLLPRLPLLKEWAYAGATFTWVMAFISAYSGHEGPQIWVVPMALLVLLGVSYATRPATADW